MKKEEIRHDNIAKCITKNEQLIKSVNKRIPDEVKKCIDSIFQERKLKTVQPYKIRRN